MQCPYCKKQIDATATLCPYCRGNQDIAKHPETMRFILGLFALGPGILLIWIPFIGIPIIVIGLALMLWGALSGISRLTRSKSPDKKLK